MKGVETQGHRVETPFLTPLYQVPGLDMDGMRGMREAGGLRRHTSARWKHVRWSGLSGFPLLYPGARALEKNGFMAAISSLAGKIVFESFPEPLRSKELLKGSFPVLGRIAGKKGVG